MARGRPSGLARRRNVRQSLEAMLAESYLGDLSAAPIDEVRRIRAALTDAEDGMSYLRRMVQGRLDVLAAEAARRDEGAGSGLDELISRLPDRLAGSTRTHGLGRPPQRLEPGSVDPDLAAELNEIVTRFGLDSVGQVETDDLWTAEAELTEFERQVSALRKQLFARIDAVEDEITRRYRNGEMSVDQLR